MADKRAFAKFDVGYLDNPKMLPVLDASPNAVLMHFASVLYCAQHLTDGFVAPRAMQRRSGASADDTTILIDAGLWHAPGHDCGSCPDVPEGKAYVHDFLEHNRSSEGVKRASEAGKRAAQSRWKGDAEPDANRIANGNAESDKSQCLEREKEREKEITTAPDGAGKIPASQLSAEFDLWYADYPKKVGKDAARKAFAKARKSTDLETLLDGLRHYRESVKTSERQFIANPATWLNAGRWEDDYSQSPAGTSPVPSAYGWFN